jgi:hypothetical protein
MILNFCAACGSRDGLQQHHLLPQSIAESDDDEDTVTLCPKHRGMAHDMRNRIDASNLIKEGVRKSHTAGKRLGPKPSPASDYAPRTPQEALWVHLYCIEGLQATEIVRLRWCDLLGPATHPLHRDVALSATTNKHAAMLIHDMKIAGDRMLSLITTTSVSAARLYRGKPTSACTPNAFTFRMKTMRKDYVKPKQTDLRQRRKRTPFAYPPGDRRHIE